MGGALREQQILCFHLLYFVCGTVPVSLDNVEKVVPVLFPLGHPRSLLLHQNAPGVCDDVLTSPHKEHWHCWGATFVDFCSWLPASSTSSTVRILGLDISDNPL